MLCVIPARAGSQGVIRKNVRTVDAIPLVALAVCNARLSGLFSDIYVSTDSDEVATIAEEYGCRPICLRPADLASNSAHAYDVYRHVLNDVYPLYDEVVVLQPTSPLRLPADIIACVELYKQHGKLCNVISVNLSKIPPQWHLLKMSQGFMVDWVSEVGGKTVGDARNRQEYVTTFVPNGAVYIISRSFLEQHQYRALSSAPLVAYEMPVDRSIDIDTHLDLEIADQLFRSSLINA